MARGLIDGASLAVVCGIGSAILCISGALIIDKLKKKNKRKNRY